MPSTLHIMTPLAEGDDLSVGQEVVEADCGHQTIANPHTVKLLAGPGPHRTMCIDCMNKELP